MSTITEIDSHSISLVKELHSAGDNILSGRRTESFRGKQTILGRLSGGTVLVKFLLAENTLWA